MADSFNVYIGSAWGIHKETTDWLIPMPGLATITVMAPDRVRVGFSQDMDFEACGMLYPPNYQVYGDDGILRDTLAVEQIDARTVEIYIVAMVSSMVYTLRVVNMRSAKGIPLDPNADEAPFVGSGIDWGATPETLISFITSYPGYGKNQQDPGWQITLALEEAEMIDELTLRVTFNQPVSNDVELVRLSNWSLEALAEGVSADFISATPPSAAPTILYVDLGLSRKITSSSYRVTVLPGKISASGRTIDAPNNTASFLAFSQLPTVSKAIPVSANEIEVTFSEEMDGTLDLTDPSRYLLDGGVSVLKVTRTGARRVLLELDQAMVPDAVYQLTVVG